MVPKPGFAAGWVMGTMAHYRAAIAGLLLCCALTAYGGGTARPDRADAEARLAAAEELFGPESAEVILSLRLAILVLESENQGRQGRLIESNNILYKALSLAQNATTIGPPEQANVLDRLAANEARRGLVMQAGAFTKKALKLRGQHYGKDSLEYSSALLTAANADRRRLTRPCRPAPSPSAGRPCRRKPG